VAKRVLQVGDLKITLQGPEQAVEPDNISIFYNCVDPQTALYAADAFGGAEGMAALGVSGLKREAGDAERGETVVNVAIEGPDPGTLKSGANTVAGRWKDAA
jgi:hypothetical protein